MEFIESDIVIEEELKEYGELQDNSNWVNIVYNALIALNNEADLNEIYSEAKKIVENRYPKKLGNKDIDATIRGILHHYSSDSKNFSGRNDLFVQVKRGRWGIRR